MEKISTATRIHPLMAVAALSVITVSIAGTAAITGLLPNSQARLAPVAAVATPEMQLAEAQQLLASQQLAAQPLSAAAIVAPAPVPQVAAHTHEVKRKPVKRKVQTQRVVYREPVRYANTADYRAPAPAPAPRAPSYVGIGTGAVIGGLIGNQIGGGNGKKLATLAGVIGGGYLGNEIAQRNQR